MRFGDIFVFERREFWSGIEIACFFDLNKIAIIISSSSRIYIAYCCERLIQPFSNNYQHRHEFPDLEYPS